MSLLNEMLKDLSQNKTRDKLPFSLVVHEKPSLSIFKSLPWIFFALSSILFLILFFSHKGKLAQPPSDYTQLTAVRSDWTEEVTRAVLATSSPQQVSILQSNSQHNQTTTLDWRPSVLVPAPIFRQDLLEPKTASNMQDPFPDENDANKINKVYTGLSPKEWYNEQFNKALDAIETGNNQEAEYILELILAKFPAAMDARESLAAIYFSEGNSTQSQDVLDEGLRIQPNALNLNVMKARLLYDQNKAAEALKLLERFHPDIHEAPDFYGLRAAILQTLGRVDEAGSLYKVLTELEPSNSQYWLGYAIALEQKHALQQAFAAYKRVTENFDIEPTVRTYAEERLKTLQG